MADLNSATDASVARWGIVAAMTSTCDLRSVTATSTLPSRLKKSSTSPPPPPEPTYELLLFRGLYTTTLPIQTTADSEIGSMIDFRPTQLGRLSTPMLRRVSIFNRLFLKRIIGVRRRRHR